MMLHACLFHEVVCLCVCVCVCVSVFVIYLPPLGETEGSPPGSGCGAPSTGPVRTASRVPSPPRSRSPRR